MGSGTCINVSTISDSSITLVNLRVESWDGLATAAILLAKDHLFTKDGLNKNNINRINAHTFFNFFRSEGSLDNVPYLSADSRDPAPVGIYNHSRKNYVRLLQNYFRSYATNVVVNVTDEKSTLSDIHFINFLKLNYGSTSVFKYYGYIDPKKYTSW
ncbi:MAG: hypothetical protein OXC44_07660 [Proteobacteria bacterium]|nr:hypothetical protein [Pseudomonadota bacterium]